MAATRGPEASQEEIRRQVEDRSFLWTGDLAALLAEYENRRSEFPTFEAFFPNVVAFFEDYADRDGR